MTGQSAARTKRNREAVDWLLKNREAGPQAEEHPAFQAWLRKDSAHLDAYRAAERLLAESRSAILRDAALHSFDATPRRGVKRAALIGAVLLATGWAAFLAVDGPVRVQADIVAGNGETPVIALSDGSTVQLNAGSAITIQMTARERTVSLLRGQAYFKVATDPSRPFVVEARAARTTALGTAFDIDLAEEETRVSVAEHAVSIASGTDAPPLRLSEGQQVSYALDGRIGPVTPSDIPAVLAWQHGQLVVDGASLSHVVAAIGRRFPGKILLLGQGLAQRRVSGTFSIADTDAALALLQASLGLKVTRLGPMIVVRAG